MEKNSAFQRFHQGDVQGQTIAELPKNAKPVAAGPIALGEHSGHEHTIFGDYQMFQEGNNYYAQIGAKGATLRHYHESNLNGTRDYSVDVEIPRADHNAIKLAPNTVVQFAIQNAYNPYTRLMEQVVD